MRGLCVLLPLCLATVGCGKQSAPKTVASVADEKPANEASRPTASEPKRDAVPEAAPELPAMPAADSAPSRSEPDPARAAFVQLIDSIQKGNPDAWQTAEARLQQLGKAAVPALTAALKDENRVAREMAAMFLAQFGLDSANGADALAGVLNDESSFVRVNAASALTTLDRHVDQAVPVLAALLKDNDPNVRITAAVALGNVGPAAEPVIAKLVAALQDEDQKVRVAVARTLGRLGPIGKASIPTLTELSRDADPELRDAASEAIKQVQGTSEKIVRE